MLMKENILEIFRLNELRISELYESYSTSVSSQRKFWKKISNEEVKHSNILNHLIEKYGKSNENFEINTHAEEIIKNIQNFIISQLKKAKDTQVSKETALETALRIEQSMIESKSFEIFKPKIKGIERVFSILNQETKRHIEALQKKYAKLEK